MSSSEWACFLSAFTNFHILFPNKIYPYFSSFWRLLKAVGAALKACNQDDFIWMSIFIFMIKTNVISVLSLDSLSWWNLLLFANYFSCILNFSLPSIGFGSQMWFFFFFFIEGLMREREGGSSNAFGEGGVWRGRGRREWGGSGSCGRHCLCVAALRLSECVYAYF